MKGKIPPAPPPLPRRGAGMVGTPPFFLWCGCGWGVRGNVIYTFTHTHIYIYICIYVYFYTYD